MLWYFESVGWGIIANISGGEMVGNGFAALMERDFFQTFLVVKKIEIELNITVARDFFFQQEIGFKFYLSKILYFLRQQEYGVFDSFRLAMEYHL